jgi:hypothetical protein
MIYVIHDEENQITDFSKSPPKEHERYFQIDLGDAAIFAYRAKRGAHLLEYDSNHQVVGLRREMSVDNEKFVQVGAGIINLVLCATKNIEEARKDIQVLQKARRLEEEVASEDFSESTTPKMEESLKLTRSILSKYQNY